jgi:hypothetical protein
VNEADAPTTVHWVERAPLAGASRAVAGGR